MKLSKRPPDVQARIEAAVLRERQECAAIAERIRRRLLELGGAELPVPWVIAGMIRELISQRGKDTVVINLANIESFHSPE